MTGQTSGQKEPQNTHKINAVTFHSDLKGQEFPLEENLS